MEMDLAMIQAVLEQLASSGPIAAVLVWFMWQHMALVKQQIAQNDKMQELLTKNTAALTRVHEVIDRCDRRA